MVFAQIKSPATAGLFICTIDISDALWQRGRDDVVRVVVQQTHIALHRQ
jgi:hypothetical protein